MNIDVVNFLKQGYTIIPNFLTQEQVLLYRQLLDNYLSNNNSYQESSISKIIPGFAGRTPELNELNNLHQNQDLLNIVKYIFQNQEFIFLDHSDLHQNKTTGWHRDTNDYKRGGGNNNDIWLDDCNIIKISFLLQDHIDNQYGLWFQPGTHKQDINITPIYANTKSTDMILFDQRILHSGQFIKPLYHEVYKQNRYLITYGFGLKNNHSYIHMKGSSQRQNQQRLNSKIV